MFRKHDENQNCSIQTPSPAQVPLPPCLMGALSQGATLRYLKWKERDCFSSSVICSPALGLPDYLPETPHYRFGDTAVSTYPWSPTSWSYCSPFQIKRWRLSGTGGAGPRLDCRLPDSQANVPYPLPTSCCKDEWYTHLLRGGEQRRPSLDGLSWTFTLLPGGTGTSLSWDPVNHSRLHASKGGVFKIFRPFDGRIPFLQIWVKE